jgi:Xaa-Pro aminopeptidase
MDRAEVIEKERRVRDLMDREKLDAVAISSIGNFAWLTCGGNNYVGIATEVGIATAVVTRDAKYVVCDNIEARRIEEEELAGQGFEIRSCYWFDGRKDDLIREVAGGGELGSDTAMAGARNIAAALDPYRYSLTPQEVERYKHLGKDVGECLSLVAREIRPGMTEHGIASVMNRHIIERGATPVVTLVAVDDRISKYRHPIPTDQKLERYAMLVTGTRRWGLVVSATRIVHFGPRSPELRCKHEAVARVDATLIAGTVPGANVGEVFRRAVDTYRLTGFAEEWKLHHQGGPTGYKGREFRATPDTDALVAENQAFAWNPSITGAKTEDTIIATSDGPIILSETEDWPKIEVEMDGNLIRRPEMLIL